MPKYVIEREIPGAGKLSPAQLKAISQTFCGVLSKMGAQLCGRRQNLLRLYRPQQIDPATAE